MPGSENSICPRDKLQRTRVEASGRAYCKNKNYEYHISIIEIINRISTTWYGTSSAGKNNSG